MAAYVSIFSLYNETFPKFNLKSASAPRILKGAFSGLRQVLVTRDL